MAEALDQANGKILENDKSPQRKVGELDNRGSHFYLAMYWARALADQTHGRRAAARRSRRSRSSSSSNEATIVGELNGVQGKPVDIGGYYHPDPALTAAGDAAERDAQRASSTRSIASEAAPSSSAPRASLDIT